MADPTPTPDALIAQTELLVSEFTDGVETPGLIRLMESRLGVAAVAARNLTFAQFADEFGIRVNVPGNVVDQSVIDFARIESSKLVTGLNDATRRGIAQTIADAIWEQRGVAGGGRLVRSEILASDIVGRLGATAGLDAPRAKRVAAFKRDQEAQGITGDKLDKRVERFHRQMLNERSKVISQTEMRNSVSEATRTQEQRFGAKEKRWITVGDERVSTVCNQNQSDGWIPIDKGFSASGKQSPSEHPRCRCTTAFRGQTREELMANLAAQGFATV